MITENLSTLKIHKLTQTQYNRELENGNIDETALYLTPENTVLSSTGDVTIINHEESETESNGKISIGEYHADINGGNFTIITRDGVKTFNNPDNVSYTEVSPFKIHMQCNYDTIPEISMTHSPMNENEVALKINTDGITYNDQTISWETFFQKLASI